MDSTQPPACLSGMGREANIPHGRSPARSAIAQTAGPAASGTASEEGPRHQDDKSGGARRVVKHVRPQGGGEEPGGPLNREGGRLKEEARYGTRRLFGRLDKA